MYRLQYIVEAMFEMLFSYCVCLTSVLFCSRRRVLWCCRPPPPFAAVGVVAGQPLMHDATRVSSSRSVHITRLEPGSSQLAFPALHDFVCCPSSRSFGTSPESSVSGKREMGEMRFWRSLMPSAPLARLVFLVTRVARRLTGAVLACRC